MEGSMRQGMHRAQSGLMCSTSMPVLCSRPVRTQVARRTAGRALVIIRAAADGGAPSPQDEGPQAISLIRRLPGPELTFVLAGFLKILTIGGLAYSAPVDAVRTLAGKMSPYMMVPVGLVMCWVAKVIVDNELQESKRFMAMLVGFLVFAYFGLYRLLYRYDPDAVVRTVERGTPGSRVAQLRAQMGDRDLLDLDGQGGASQRDAKMYPTMEGRNKEYERTSGENPYWQGKASSTATLDARNPARQYQRRA